jgi:pimeloyl-ACP methyl ester carboxylesterase
MVLVDSSHPDQLTRFAGIGLEIEIPEKQIRPVIFLLSTWDVRTLQRAAVLYAREVYEAEQAFLPESGMAWYDETVESPNTLAQAGQYKSLGSIPLIVLASARPTSIQIKGQDVQDTWLELQQELTLLSNNSEIRLLRESGHYIQFDQPEAVIEAIYTVVQQCPTVHHKDQLFGSSAMT